MKFTKPISREVGINDETYVVTFDESGVDFRIKGKRKSIQAAWPALLEAAGAPSKTVSTRSPEAQERHSQPAAETARAQPLEQGYAKERESVSTSSQGSASVNTESVNQEPPGPQRGEEIGGVTSGLHRTVGAGETNSEG